MKTIGRILGLLALAGSVAYAAPLTGVDQSTSTGHAVGLSWTASPDGGTVNVYRAPGTCGASSSFAQIANGVPSAGPYSDTSVAVGQSCYQVTAVVGGAESSPSNQITITVTPQPPTGLAAKVTQ